MLPYAGEEDAMGILEEMVNVIFENEDGAYSFTMKPSVKILLKSFVKRVRKDDVEMRQ